MTTDPTRFIRIHSILLFSAISFYLGALPVAAGEIWKVDDIVHGNSLEGNLLKESPDRAVTLFLPPGYYGSSERYPVVYLLHGAFADQRLWAEAFHLDAILDSLYTQRTISPMIFVMPDASTLYRGNLYVNSPVTGNWEDFISRDLIEHIDLHYRTLPQPASRGIAGHSMGGFGSMWLAMKNPEIFHSVYSMSPVLGWVDPEATMVLRARDFPNTLALQVDNLEDLDAMRGGTHFIHFALGAALSPNPNKLPFLVDLPYEMLDGEPQRIEAVWNQWVTHTPLGMLDEYGENLAQLRGIRFDSGTQDLAVGVLQDSRAFAAALRAAGIPHVYEEYEGNHDNRVSERLATRVLPFFSEVLEAQLLEPGQPRLQSFSPAVVATAVGQPTPLEVAVILENLPEVGAGESRLILDLSPLEPSRELVLQATGGKRYAASTSVIPRRNGQYGLPLWFEEDGRRQVLLDLLLQVWPQAEKIFDGGPDLGWTASGKGVSEMNLNQTEMIYTGDAAGAFQVEGSLAGWTVEFSSEELVDLFGYGALRFAIWPERVETKSNTRLTVGISSGKIVNLLADGWVNLEQQEWQVVEIPLAEFETAEPITEVKLAGNFEGKFYLDDVQLMSHRPADLPTAVLGDQNGGRPEEFSLAQNFPNPFNRGTVIRFELSGREDVELSIFNLAGQKVATLVEGTRETGSYAVHWNGRDREERELASGIYLYRLQTGTRIETRKLLLLQ